MNLSKRLIFTGAVALVISVGFDSFDHRPQNTRLGSALPFGGVAFAQTPPTAGKPVMSEVAFKNIQILKGIPVDEFMGTMGLFSAALNVCCGDCHVGAGGSDPKWEEDPPKKKIARQMIAMVEGINKANFGGRQIVTCWTCHRGSENPAVTPSIDLIYGEPSLPPPDMLPTIPSNMTPDQIIDKYISALGGEANLAKLTSYVGKGTGQLFGEEKTDPAEVYAKAPDEFATVIHEREGDMERVSNGHEAWVQLPLTVVQQYPLIGSMLAGGKVEGAMAFPWRLKSLFKTWKLSFPTTIDGKDVNVIQGTGTPGTFATFYFDKKTGLLTRYVRYVNTAMGRVPTQVDFSDYRPVAGVMMPFKWTYGWVSGREFYVMSEIEPNVSIDAAKFGKPVERAK